MGFDVCDCAKRVDTRFFCGSDLSNLVFFCRFNLTEGARWTLLDSRRPNLLARIAGGSS